MAKARRVRRSKPGYDRPDLALDFGWKSVAWALLRSAVSFTLLVTAYFLLPLNRKIDAGGVGLLLVGLLLMGATVAWQIRAIFRARYPVLRGIEALTIAIPLFLLTFAALYFQLAASREGTFTEPLSKTDALYFTVTVFATVGFGDIAPVTETARIVTTVQMLGDLIVLGVLLRSIVGAVKVTKQHRSAAAGTVPSSPLADEGTRHV